MHDLNETVRDSVIEPPKLNDKVTYRIAFVSKLFFVLLFLVIFVTIILLILFLPPPNKFEFRIDVDRVMRHITEFDSITTQFGPRNTIRSFSKSMEYLTRETSGVRMNVTRDVFDVPYFTQNAPAMLSF